jgi:ABC-type transport system involved in cytochrome bd biosynthesis fused ATPase/permease subunit
MGSSAEQDDDTILRCAQSYGLGDVLGRLGGLSGKVAEAGRNLSAGEIRRVLLTRAALSPSSLLLLDEPDDALDTDGIELVEKLIFNTPATTLLVTHNRELATKMDEMWTFENGQLRRERVDGSDVKQFA